MSTDKVEIPMRRHVRRRIRREIAKRRETPGVIVAGRFPLFLATRWPYAISTLSVGVNDSARAVDTVRPGPLWFELNRDSSNELRVGAGRKLFRQRFRVGDGPVLVLLEPPRRGQKGKGPKIWICDASDYLY